MADTRIFTRLQRLFSTDVIIRNQGGNQLKIIDTNSIQKSGDIATNSLIDRFSRIYSPSTTSLLGSQINVNWKYLRTIVYSDYDNMDYDAIVASALDIISDECTLKNDMREVLQIQSNNEDIQQILYNLFYDILNIEFNLWSWIRQMCKYGDFFLKLEIAEKYGVYNVIPYTAYHIERQENFSVENPNSVRFRYAPGGIYAGGSGYYGITNPESKDENSIFFENYEMAHFRLLTDVNYLPYGRSYLEPARRIFKQYILMEDAMLIHRISRSPDRRIFYINVGSIPPNEVENFMQKTISTMKRTPLVDQKTGEYNLKYNMQNLLEDFYIPVRGNDTTTKVDTTPGLTYDGIEDVEYLRDKLFAALKVPKAFMGYEKDLCISPDTLIPLLDGRTITAQEIINEYNEGKKNYVYSLDEITQNIVPGEIEWAGFTRMNTQTIKVWLDNGEYIQCTPDHLFLTRNNEWKEAQNLIEGESLMPLYLQKSTNKSINGYTQVYNPSTGKYEYVHRLVANYYGLKQDKKVIHHKDFNKLNNNPENLDCSMDFWEHSKYHANHNQNTLQKWIKENGASRKGFVKNPIGICKGCKNTFDKIKLQSSKRNNIYCSDDCKKINWVKKHNISIDILLEKAKESTNFKELKQKLNIKDYSTLRKAIKNHGFKIHEFIIENMPKAHSNIYFMNQYPETNQFYIDTFNPKHNEWKQKYSYKNHKVSKIEWVDENIDTCDLTITKYHNFGTSAGVIIHNSGKATLAAEDIRFARTIDRIQRIALSELYKIALVHLYTQGYQGDDLTNFELNLTTPSIIYDQEKIELLQKKVDLAEKMMETNLFPTDFIYENLFHFSEDQYNEYRDLIAEDQKRNFRFSQIKEEGNDPKVTGQSYGTPHDLASLYGQGRMYSNPTNVPDGYGEDIKLGRPKEKSTTSNTQNNALGKDRLGNKGMKVDDNESDSIKPTYKGGSPLALEAKQVYLKNKSIIDTLKTNFNKYSLLNEDQIKD
jgi:hypothetical protein